MEKITLAENLHLVNENQSLRRNLMKIIEKNKMNEFEDLLAAFSISELQRERITFLIKELQYVEDRKKTLVEEEKIHSALKSISSADNLEERLQNAKYKKQQLEMELEGLERKKTRDLTEIKKSSAKQDVSVLLNL